MSKPIRYLLDEHVHSAIFNGLYQRSIEIATFQDLGRGGLKDIEQLKYADVEGWVIATYDKDYLILHKRDPHHAGIIWWKKEKYTNRQIIEMLDEYHLHFNSDDFREQLIIL